MSNSTLIESCFIKSEICLNNILSFSFKLFSYKFKFISTTIHHIIKDDFLSKFKTNISKFFKFSCIICIKYPCLMRANTACIKSCTNNNFMNFFTIKASVNLINLIILFIIYFNKIFQFSVNIFFLNL